MGFLFSEIALVDHDRFLLDDRWERSPTQTSPSHAVAQRGERPGGFRMSCGGEGDKHANDRWLTRGNTG